MTVQDMQSPIIIALDYPNESTALSLVEKLDPTQCRLKVGKEMFTRLGPQFVEKLIHLGFEIFLDLKYHDIPNTVAAACDAAGDLGVWMINLHTSGGRRMMEAAADRLSKHQNPPLLVGVTILTSLSQDELREIGFPGSPSENVLRLARLAESCGLDGVVCSPLEAAEIRQATNPSFILVTPGVRPKSASLDDQRRVMTPADAIQAGADYLVIGRPITASPDPTASLANINNEIRALANQ